MLLQTQGKLHCEKWQAKYFPSTKERAARRTWTWYAISYFACVAACVIAIIVSKEHPDWCFWHGKHVNWGQCGRNVLSQKWCHDAWTQSGSTSCTVCCIFCERSGPVLLDSHSLIHFVFMCRDYLKLPFPHFPDILLAATLWYHYPTLSNLHLIKVKVVYDLYKPLANTTSNSIWFHPTFSISASSVIPQTIPNVPTSIQHLWLQIKYIDHSPPLPHPIDTILKPCNRNT